MEEAEERDSQEYEQEEERQRGLHPSGAETIFRGVEQSEELHVDDDKIGRADKEKDPRQEAEGDIKEVGQAVKKKRGQPRKDIVRKEGGRQEAIFPGPSKGSVRDGGVGECVDPERNGVNPGEGDGGGAGPPSEEQDKQLISSSGGVETPMGQPEKQEDESGATARPIMHRVHNVINDCILYVNSNGACVTVIRCLIVDCFRGINHMAVKDHLHSSPDVQRVTSGTKSLYMHLYNCLLVQ